MIAIDRISRWAQSHCRPSLISWLMRVGGPGRGTRNEPRTLSTSSAAAANEMLSSANGTTIAAVNRTAPSGGPTKSRETISAEARRLLANSSRGRSTRAGTMACAALSNIVSPVPSAKATRHSSQIDARSVAMATASRPTTPKRKRSVYAMIRRRSSRSTSAPLNNANRAHGRPAATDTAAIGSGSRVRLAASSGMAAVRTPSPSVETAAAVQMRQNRLSREAFTATASPNAPQGSTGFAIGGSRQTRSTTISGQPRPSM